MGASILKIEKKTWCGQNWKTCMRCYYRDHLLKEKASWGNNYFHAGIK